jgi:chromosome segregation ATPase
MEEFPLHKYQPIPAEDTDDEFESKDEETSEEIERRKWIEGHMRAVKENEELFEQEQQRLSELHAKFYQTVENALSKGESVFPHASSGRHAAGVSQDPPGKFQQMARFFSFSSPPSEKAAYIKTLKEGIKQDQKDIAGLKEKQQNLIKEVLALFSRHKNHSEKLLQQLEKEKTVNVVHLQQCRALFESANEKVKELKKQSIKKTSNFERCRSYIIDAGQFYQLGYGSIIALVDQQPALKNAPMKITVIGTNIAAGNNVHIGPMTINESCEIAEKELKSELRDKQNKFNKIKARYDALQREHQKDAKELTALKLQQGNFSDREAALLQQISEAQQEAQNATDRIEQARREMDVMQRRIIQLEAESVKVKNYQAPATALTVMGLMPKPREGASNNPVNHAAAFVIKPM